jgi:signal peptidase I
MTTALESAAIVIPPPKRKRWWAALLLSFLCPGLGQLYAGRPWRACAALIFMCVVIIPAVVLLPLFISWSLVSTLAGYMASVVFLMFVPIDAALCARLAAPVVSTPKMRWLLYVAFIMAGVSLINLTPVWLLPILPLRESRVPTGAMIPTILIGDHIIVDRRLNARSSLTVGDIAVFESPDDPGKEYVKRLAGFPGSLVEVRAGLLYVDGVGRSSGIVQPNREGLVTEGLGPHTYQVRLSSAVLADQCQDWGPERVPEGAFFMLGDNRCYSRDSRSFGAVPTEYMRGRAVRLHWSQDPETKRVRWRRLGMSLLGR